MRLLEYLHGTTEAMKASTETSEYLYGTTEDIGAHYFLATRSRWSALARAGNTRYCHPRAHGAVCLAPRATRLTRNHLHSLSACECARVSRERCHPPRYVEGRGKWRASPAVASSRPAGIWRAKEPWPLPMAPSSMPPSPGMCIPSSVGVEPARA